MPTTPSTPAAVIAAALEALPAATLRELALRATERARALGLAVVRSTGDVDIALTLTPEIIAPEAVAERARDAHLLLSAMIKAARAVFSGGVESPRARALFAHFGPLESRCLVNWEAAEDVTIARIDWFLDATGRHHALELNATIPAMEAYSDTAARVWVETLGAHAGLSGERVEALLTRNGSNTEELRQSILAHAGKAADATPSIAILHRDGDSQLRELEAVRRHLASKGHAVRLATPADVTLAEDGRVRVGGDVPEILYRHIFARRIPEDSALAEIALGRSEQRLQNPVNGHLEVKGLLADLVRTVSEEDGAWLGLSDEERATVLRVVPWTRLLSRESCLDPDGGRAGDIAQVVEESPERFVLKRSWDYGGKSVLIGRDVVAQDGAATWRRKVREALADGTGAWVVQALVDSPRKRHLVVGALGETTWEDVFVDASTYSASGNDRVPGGGVTRFARVGVVNIVGGGGVAPLVRTDVAAEIATALARRR